jgi:hypothetical protein
MLPSLRMVPAPDRWDPFFCSVQYLSTTNRGPNFVFHARETCAAAAGCRGAPQGGPVWGGSGAWRLAGAGRAGGPSVPARLYAHAITAGRTKTREKAKLPEKNQTPESGAMGAA